MFEFLGYFTGRNVTALGFTFGILVASSVAAVEIPGPVPSRNSVVSGSSVQGDSEDQKVIPERIGGTFNVASIDPIGNETGSTDGFAINFVAETPTGKFDKLRLETSHVHVSVKVGMKMRLSAEIMSVESDGTALARQILVFVPTLRGPVPVWLLSRHGGSLEAARYLEMNVPLNDYYIF